MLHLFIVVFLWIALLIAIPTTASRLGRNAFGWFALACVVTPFIAIMVLYASGAKIKFERDDVPLLARDADYWNGR